MKRRLTALLLSCVMALGSLSLVQAASTKYPSDIPAFPGAEGGGKYTSGGRGQEVYTVTTLEDYAKGEEPIKGSLRDAVSKDNRTIVFNVGGTIVLKEKLDITKRKNLTLAGQTAPGGGITIYGFETNISNAENIIIRYLRFRPGAINVHQGDSMDAIWGRSMKNIMVDHISTSWNTDETMSLYRAENMTVQWSIIAESLTMSGHTKGRHGYGAIWGGTNTTYHHNLLADHTSRSPRFGGGTVEADDNEHIAKFDVRNNVVYNWGYNSCYGGGRGRSNYVYNYLKPGPGTRDSVAKRVINPGEANKPGWFYVADNYFEGQPEITVDNSKGIDIGNSAKPTTTIVNSMFTMDGIKPENLRTTSARDAYNEVLAKSGAVYPKRDAVDSRIIYQVKNNTGKFINVDAEVGGLPVRDVVERPEGFDTDGDGMPNKWEEAHGLNPDDPADGRKLADDNSGYTNLEIYLNSLVDMEYEPENPEVKITSVSDNDMFLEGDTVRIEASAKPIGNRKIAKVEFYNGADKVFETTKSPYVYEVSSLKDGSYHISAKAIDSDGNETQSDDVEIHVNGLSIADTQWDARDIGNVEAKGVTVVNAEDNLTVKGSGKFTGKQDTAQFAYKKLSGDGEIVAKLDSVTAVDNHAFSGLMIRSSLSPSSPAVGVGLSSTKAYEWKEFNPDSNKEVTYYRNAFSIYLVGRDKEGDSFSRMDENLDGEDSAKKSKVSLIRDIAFKNLDEFLGYYMKLTREGDVFTAYCSPDGKEWTKVGTRTVSMPTNVYIGLAVDANKVDNKLVNVSTAKFSNISFSGSVSKAR